MTRVAGLARADVRGLVSDGVRLDRMTALRRLGAVFAALATLSAMFVLFTGAPAQAASSGDGGGAAATASHDLAVGKDHTCAIDAGDVRCWGGQPAW